jgi:hypothetical protein
VVHLAGVDAKHWAGGAWRNDVLSAFKLTLMLGSMVMALHLTTALGSPAARAPSGGAQPRDDVERAEPVDAHARAGDLWAARHGDAGALAREIADLIPEAMHAMRAGH